MEEKDILNFKEKIKNFTRKELIKEREKINDDITKMILDSDLVLKAALLEAAIEATEKVKEA